MKMREIGVGAISLWLCVGLTTGMRAAGRPPAPRSTPAKRGGHVPPSPELARLRANTWVHVRPSRNPAGRSYSGICYGGGLIFYFGGGHHSYPGNDVELYDVAGNTWTQATEPESWRDAHKWTHITDADKEVVKGIGGGWGVPVLSPKGRPLTEHTYQMHTWFPQEKAFYSSLTSGLWAFDPAKREWSKQCDRKGTPRGRDIHTWNLAYDPDLKTLVSIVVAGPARGVFVFDRHKRTWSRRCAVPVSSWTEVYSTYDSARKRHVVFGGRRWWTLDLGAGKTRFIRPLEAAVQAARRSGKPPQLRSVSIEYDPQSRRTLVVIKGRDAELWAYDPDRDGWSAVEMAGRAPAGTVAWDLLVYAPQYRCFLFLNVVGVQGALADGLFAFRYAPSQIAKQGQASEDTGQ